MSKNKDEQVQDRAKEEKGCVPLGLAAVGTHAAEMQFQEAPIGGRRGNNNNDSVLPGVDVEEETMICFFTCQLY